MLSPYCRDRKSIACVLSKVKESILPGPVGPEGPRGPEGLPGQPIERFFGQLGFVSNSVPTVFTVPGNFEVVKGTYAANNLNGFIRNQDNLEYTELTPRTFEVTATMSIKSVITGTTDAVECAIGINGTEVSRSRSCMNVDDSSEYPRCLTSQCILSLAVGDQVDVRISNNTDTDSVNVIDLQLIVVPLT